MYLLAGSICTFYIVRDGIYTIGNSSKSDFVVKHPSVCEKHAEIIVEDSKVSIRKSSTAPVEVDLTKLRKNQKLSLEIDNRIILGELTFLFKFENDVLTCATGLSNETKALVKENVGKINGGFLERWIDECTHLTANKVVATLKFLHAFIDNKPIVLPEYWTECSKAVINHEPLPDPSKFYPPIGENVLNTKLTKYNPKRTRLFQNKLFLSFEKIKVQKIIEKIGGKCVTANERFSTNSLRKLMDESLIVIQPENPAIFEKFKDVLEFYTDTKKRLIPIHEVILAILQSSCSVHCNPTFNKLNELFNQKNETPDPPEIVVPETQDPPAKKKICDVNFNAEVELIRSKSENSRKRKDFSADRDVIIIDNFNDETSISTKRPKLANDSMINPLSSHQENCENKVRADPEEIVVPETQNIVDEQIPSTSSASEQPMNSRKNQRDKSEAEVANEPPAKKKKQDSIISSSKSDKEKASPPSRSCENEDPFEDFTMPNPLYRPPRASRTANSPARPSTSRGGGWRGEDSSASLSKSGNTTATQYIKEEKVDYSGIKHEITIGKIYCAVKKENNSGKSSQNDENSEWYKRFTSSVNITTNSTQASSNNSMIKNFKKFRKVPVIKSGILLECSR